MTQESKINDNLARKFNRFFHIFYQIIYNANTINSFKNLLHNAITVVYLQLTIVQFYIFSHSHLGAPGLLKLKQTLTSHAHVHVRTTCTMCLWSGDI